jgi:ABC-type uncharacterized transport system permease subunit
VERIPYIAVLAAYALAAVAHLLPALVGDRVVRSARWIALSGVLVHATTLAAGAFLSDRGPAFPEALSATALGAVIAYVWVGTERMRALGLLLMPLAVVLLGIALVVPPHQVAALRGTGFSPWLPIHLALIFSGIGGFALSSGVGVLYLWVRDRLKKKKIQQVMWLPSLEALDRTQFRAMLFGFTFLTLGIGAGGAWAAATLQDAWSVDAKVWFTVLIWFWYGVALQVRLVLGRRGRWTALFSIVGFCGLVFSLFGVNLLLSGWHGYGP